MTDTWKGLICLLVSHMFHDWLPPHAQDISGIRDWINLVAYFGFFVVAGCYLFGVAAYVRKRRWNR